MAPLCRKGETNSIVRSQMSEVAEFHSILVPPEPLLFPFSPKVGYDMYSSHMVPGNSLGALRYASDPILLHIVHSNTSGRTAIHSTVSIHPYP